MKGGDFAEFLVFMARFLGFLMLITAVGFVIQALVVLQVILTEGR